MPNKYSIYICEDAIGNMSNESHSDELFWRADHRKLRLLSASLDLEINKAGKLTFQMMYNHPLADKVHKRRTRFYVARDGQPLWSGRVLETNKTFQNAIEVTVEGAMTYFLDTVQRPYDYDDIIDLCRREGFIPSTQYPPTIPVKWLLYYLIHEHNKEADSDKKIDFNITNDIVYNNKQDDFLNKESLKKKYKSEEYSTTKDEINSEIVEKYGGIIFLKYNKTTHRNRLVYCVSDEGIVSDHPQTIEFAKNMIDFSEAVTAEGIYTRCIPLGCTYGDVETLRKKMYDKEKKEYNDAINEYNKQVRDANKRSKEEAKALAEANKKAEEDKSVTLEDGTVTSYSQYKLDLAEYTKLKYWFDIGKITEEPTRPETVPAPKSEDTGRAMTLKDYGYDASAFKAKTIPAEDKMDSWDETGWAMPESVDKNEKVTLNTYINLWYKSPWSAHKDPSINDYVTYSSDDLKRFGKITNAVELKVSLPKTLPGTEKQCAAAWKGYIDTLKEKGKNWLKKNRRMNTTLSVTAFDLANLSGNQLDHIDCGYSIPVYSPIHGVQNRTQWDDIDFGINSNTGIDMDLLCSASTINLLSPGESDYTIGAAFKALTDKSVANKEQSGKAYGLARSSYSL